MQQAHEVSAVIHRDGWPALEYRTQMTVVGVAIFVVNGVGRNVVFLNQRRGNIVLGRERVRRTAEYFRAAGLERAQQVGGFASDVQARAEALALERELPGKA